MNSYKEHGEDLTFPVKRGEGKPHVPDVIHCTLQIYLGRPCPVEPRQPNQTISNLSATLSATLSAGLSGCQAVPLSGCQAVSRCDTGMWCGCQAVWCRCGAGVVQGDGL